MTDKQYDYIAVDFDGTVCEHDFPRIGRKIYADIYVDDRAINVREIAG